MNPRVARRIRILRLQAAVAFGDLLAEKLAPILKQKNAIPADAPGPGVSVIIPERASPGMLGRCLEATAAASQGIEEPVEVLVVVNGSIPGDYREPAGRFGSVRWTFHSRPLGLCRSNPNGPATPGDGDPPQPEARTRPGLRIREWPAPAIPRFP